MRTLALVDGRLVDASQLRIPVTDPAVTVGWAVFETLRSDEEARPVQLDEHLDRLAMSAERAAIPMPPRQVLADEIERAASLMADAARIRLTLSGSGWRAVVVQPLDLSRFHQPVRAVRGAHCDEPFLGGAVKHTSRAPWVAAVKHSGVDEVLLVDREGRFTEGTTCAILAVVDGRLWTAPHDGRILQSTTCTAVIDRARAAGVEVVRTGPRADGPWDALYVASTTRDLAPVVELDGAPLPGWDPMGRRLLDPAVSAG